MPNYTPTHSLIYDKLVSAAVKRPRYILSEGGTRSGKTYAALQLLYFLADKDKEPTINSVVSETFPHLKRGAIRDFKAMFGAAWDERNWSKSESIFTCPRSGSIIEFFSADTPAKVHGPKRKRLFLNEIQNIDYDTARQLFVRTEGLIMMDYNPTHLFWAQEKIEPRENCFKIHSTYLDNIDSLTGEPFLSDEQIKEIESNKNDTNWWNVYGLGKVGVLEGLIYDFEQIDALPEDTSSLKEVYGLDFGFTNDPTAIVRLFVDTRRKVVYADERCYQTRMLNSDIAALLREEHMPSNVSVFADCAEPKSIEEIARDGVNIVACDKDAPVRSDKLKFQLQWMQGWKFYFTKRSINLIKEARNYTWAKDRDGNPLNQPIDKWNHILDAMRYALWSKFGSDYSEGQYSISIL